LLLVACLISSVMLSGTFAKYTSEYAGQDTALVARWSFGANVDETGLLAPVDGLPAIELPLFDHAYQNHINQYIGNEDNETYIIAPGVSGEFVLQMDYLADVDADVTIDITELEGNVAVPMEYSVDGGDTWVTLANLPEALAVKIASVDADPLTDPAIGDKTFRIAAVTDDTHVDISETVMWRWAYDKAAQEAEDAGEAAIISDDEFDTGLGEASGPDAENRTSYGIQVTLTATQVAPGTTTPPGGEE
jgi:hypothetical protein